MRRKGYGSLPSTACGYNSVEKVNSLVEEFEGVCDKRKVKVNLGKVKI